MDAPQHPLPTPGGVLLRRLQKLVEHGVQRRYRTRALLIEEGDTGRLGLHRAVGPAAGLSVLDSRGREVTLALHGPGEYVGEMSLDGGPRSASVEAVEPTVCAVVTRETVLQHIAGRIRSSRWR